jgi:hypothetical protein
MLNLVQHLVKSMSYETLKQVQGDILGLFTRPPILDFLGFTKARNVGEPFLLKMQEVIGVDL